MNIHEYQAKEILKKFGASVPNGSPIFSLDEIDKKFKTLKTKKVILKAQIHAGGRGKAGGIKIVNSIEELKKPCKKLIWKKINYASNWITRKRDQKIIYGGDL